MMRIFVNKFRFFDLSCKQASSMFFLIMLFIIVRFVLKLVHFFLCPGRKLVVTKFEGSLVFFIVLLDMLIFVFPNFISELVLFSCAIFNLIMIKMLVELCFSLWMIDQSNNRSSFVGNIHYLILINNL